MSARFYPMLLLPLVQRAVRTHADALPDSIRIGVQKVDGEIVIVTRIAQVDGCAEDFELARVRERLAGLYGDRASLQCVELEPQTTQFTLRVPAER
jgi:LytS/YehU family sensor histidine kinase